MIGGGWEGGMGWRGEGGSKEKGEMKQDHRLQVTLQFATQEKAGYGCGRRAGWLVTVGVVN